MTNVISPLGFRFRNEEDENVIFTLKSAHTFQLTIENQRTSSILIPGLLSETASSDKFHFSLFFRPGVLQDPSSIGIEALGSEAGKWVFSPLEARHWDGAEGFYLLRTQGGTIQPDTPLQFRLTNIKAAPGQGSKGTLLLLNPNNLYLGSIHLQENLQARLIILDAAPVDLNLLGTAASLTASVEALSDRHDLGPLRISAGGGEVGIGQSNPRGTLDVARGTAAHGTAVFRGTNHASHFNYSTSENTYIRGGKSGSSVLLNDTGGNVGVGLGDPRATLDVARGTAADGTAVFRGTSQTSHFNYNIAEHTYIRGGKADSSVLLNDVGGNVGVGLGNPRATLDVARGKAAHGTAVFRGTTYASYFNYSTSENIYIRGGKQGSFVLLNDKGGYVGVNLHKPKAPLHVQGEDRGTYRFGKGNVGLQGGNRSGNLHIESTKNIHLNYYSKNRTIIGGLLEVRKGNIKIGNITFDQSDWQALKELISR